MQPGELVRRFCSKLGINNQAIKVVQEPVMIVEELVKEEPEIDFGRYYLHDKSSFKF